MKFPQETGSIEPLPDETLMSFLTRKATDNQIRIEDFVRHVDGSIITSARLGERKAFDWNRLSNEVGVAPETLFQMSERSFMRRQDDTSRLLMQSLRAMPWAQTKGYPVYSPTALARSEHLRQSWLRPGWLVDAPTKTLSVRHCGECKSEVGAVRWSKASPECPACGAPLGATDSMEAPARIVEYAGALSAKLDREDRDRPVDVFSPVLTLCAATWHAVEVLEKKPDLVRLSSYLADEAGVGPLQLRQKGDSFDVARAALRYAQLWVAADHACRRYPEVTRRFQLMVKFPANLVRAQAGIESGLNHLSKALGMK